MEMNKENGITRRDFLKASAATTAVLLTGQAMAFADGSDELRVGLIGCGGRGTGAACDCVNSSKGVKIVAMGDLFKDHMDECYGRLMDVEEVKDKIAVSPENRFVGFDAYKKVLASGVDMVILTTPPGFRPTHFKAAIEAGKHVFMEKPVAVDATGIRTVMEAGKLAAAKKLGVVAGTQRRHEFSYIETMKRIHDGAIGEIVAAQCYWNQGGLWSRPEEADWSGMEWQIRNWLYFTWLSGDHIVEQNVHNIDVINWAMNAHPVKAVGLGGRQVRTSPLYGHIYDHFAIEYEYPNGARVMSMCRQIDNCCNNVSERVVGTKGTSDCIESISSSDGKWKYTGEKNAPYVQEHADLIASIRAGKPLNEAQRVAESCLTAIMGRMSAYTGQSVSWDEALDSKENLMPDKLEFCPLAIPPVAMPGKTPLV